MKYVISIFVDIISTVGPKGESPENQVLLKSCYENCLMKMMEHGMKSIAFPCISTGSKQFLPSLRLNE